MTIVCPTKNNHGVTIHANCRKLPPLLDVFSAVVLVVAKAMVVKFVVALEVEDGYNVDGVVVVVVSSS